MGFNRVLRHMALLAAVIGSLGMAPLGAGAQTPPAAPAPAPATPAPDAPAPAPSAQAPASPAPVGPAPPAVAPPPAVGTAPPPDAPNSSDRTIPDTSISQTIDVQSHPVIMLSGQSTWDEGFKTINDAFSKLNGALGKTEAKPAGYPTAVFTETDDAGFKFSAMIPVDKAPDGKPDLPSDLSFGMSPSGKAMKFQHRSAYDDIDSTYEAITAYLDEKGLEAKNMFAEEYINRTKTSDDPTLEVDILVFLK